MELLLMNIANHYVSETKGELNRMTRFTVTAVQLRTDKKTINVFQYPVTVRYASYLSQLLLL